MFFGRVTHGLTTPAYEVVRSEVLNTVQDMRSS
jgi:hypothetical protein